MTAHPGLTACQAHALDVIKGLINGTGRSPSIREIVRALGIGSYGRAQELVNALVERGHLDRIPNRARTLTIRSPDDGVRLPPDLQRTLTAYCAANGEDPASVVADAVALHLDELNGKVAA